MGNSIRLPEDYGIFAPLELHLFEMCREKNVVQGVLFFADYEGRMLAVASARTEIGADIGVIESVAMGVETPMSIPQPRLKISEIHPFLTHGHLFYKPIPLYFSVKSDRVLYVGDNRPKPDVVSAVSCVSSNSILENRVAALKKELGKILTETTPSLVSSSLATRIRYTRLPYDPVE